MSLTLFFVLYLFWLAVTWQIYANIPAQTAAIVPPEPRLRVVAGDRIDILA